MRTNARARRECRPRTKSGVKVGVIVVIPRFSEYTVVVARELDVLYQDFLVRSSLLYS